MRIRSAAILIQNNAIALIERKRGGMHYFTFPGGGVNKDETPEAAVLREVFEELGVEIRVLRLVAKLWFRGNPQFFYLVELVGGQFGTGKGEEYSPDLDPTRGTYHPLWMPLSEITIKNVLPKGMAELVRRSYPDNWSDKPVILTGN
jgi:8-oxo-dGTP pyrophosphatase MutT (NUDIX family)